MEANHTTENIYSIRRNTVFSFYSVLRYKKDEVAPFVTVSRRMI